jgi:hypothetical protein
VDSSPNLEDVWDRLLRTQETIKTRTTSPHTTNQHPEQSISMSGAFNVAHWSGNSYHFQEVSPDISAAMLQVLKDSLLPPQTRE